MYFLMSYSGLGWYISILLTLVGFIYIIRLKDKAPLHRILNLSLAVLLVSFVLPFAVVYAVYHPAAAYIAYLLGCLPAAPIILLLFIYNFPRNIHARESRWVNRILWGLFLLWCLSYYPALVGSVPEFRIGPQLWGLNALTPSRLATLFGFVLIVTTWGVVVSLRKSISMGRGAKTGASSLQSLWSPSNDEARGLRSIAAACFVVVCALVLYLLAMANVFADGFRAMMMAMLPMFATAAFAQLYIVSVPERISFQAKSIGVAVITMFLCFGLGGMRIFSSEEKLLTGGYAHSIEVLKARIEAKLPPRIEKDVRYLARRTDSGYKTIAAAPGTRVPPVLAHREGIKVGRDALSRDGTRTFRVLPGGEIFIVRDFRVGEYAYQVGFDYLAYRRYMHQGTIRLLVFSLAVLALLLLTFPRLFYAGIGAPLSRLLAAVRKVSDGDYSIRLPIRGRDDIGELSRAFNIMSKVIRENTAELENKVRERTAGLELSNRKLAEADRLKTNFFTNLSHELRTPLTLIISPLERMLNGKEGGVAIDAAHVMHRNALRLLGLVNNLLNFSRLDAGGDELNARPGDIVKYVRELAADFETITGSRGLELRVTADRDAIIASFDSERVETILLNLLSNAVKFTRTGGITVMISASGANLEIAVKDTGPGVPEAVREKIFERFGRDARYHGEHTPGSGIGLALAGELAHSHGGRILLESTPGKGSVFTLRLPGIVRDEVEAEVSPLKTSPTNRDFFRAQLSYDRPGSRANQNENEIDPAKNLVLIVEDHEDLRVYIGDILNHDFQVVSAADGREGFELARRLEPDLIVSDVMMPVMNGLELLSAVREDDKLKNIPVVLLTAKATVADRLLGLGLEADDYITKPFHAEEFLLRVRNLVHRTGMLQVMIENSRREIYGDLHDHLGARLTDMAILTDRLLGETKMGAPISRREELLDELERTIGLIRGGFKSWLLEVEDLRLLNDDFMDGLQLSLIRRYSGSDRLLHFFVDEPVRELLNSTDLDAVKSILFAAAREITTNDLKYGRGPARWTLSREGDRLSLRVVSGSEYGTSTGGTGLGMAGIRRRVEEPGGELRESLENGIYTIDVALPLPAPILS